jgi:hypothetical protein
MFGALFPYKDNEPSAVWVFRFVRSENYGEWKTEKYVKETLWKQGVWNDSHR